MNRMPKVLVAVLTLALFACLVVPVLAADTKGKIKSIKGDKNEFVLTDTNGKDFTFHLEEKAKVYANNKIARLDDLRVGDEVTVTYQDRNGQLMATEVRCTRKE